MNPALLLVCLAVGTTLLTLGVLAVVFGWLPLAQGVVIAVLGLGVETASALAFARSRRGTAKPPAGK
jgi:hypothetical protein